MNGNKQDIGEDRQSNNGGSDQKLSSSVGNISSEQYSPYKKYEDTHFIDTSKPVWNYSLLSDVDVRNFQQGTHYRLYEKFGSHSLQLNNVW